MGKVITVVESLSYLAIVLEGKEVVSDIVSILALHPIPLSSLDPYVLATLL
jgi:hypothetical protein